MITQLDLYILNNDNSVAPFPSEAEQIVLYDFTFEAQRMGSAPEITATIQANGSLENSLTTKVFCEYNGERYFLKNLPSSSKENTDPRYTFDLTFVSERTILDDVYIKDAVQSDSDIDRHQSDNTNIVFTGTIEESVRRLNAFLAYAGIDYSVVLDEGITTESKLVSIQDKFFTEALQEISGIYNIPYYYVGKVVHFGWSQATIPTIKYGDGLLSIDKSTNTERIVNRATATGSSENIPYYYPNPTPRGEIKVTHGGSMDLVVDNYYKASKIPEGTTLAYRDAWGKVDLFAYYPYYMGSIDVFSPPVEYDKKEKNGVIYDGNARSFFFAGIRTGANYNLPIDVDIEAVFKATMDNPFNSNVEIRGLQLYEDNNGVLKAIDSQIDYSYDLDLGEWGKSNTLKLTLKISLKEIPSDSVRFLSVELKNNQGLSNHIPVKFSFNNYQYGHDAGWYIKSSNEHYEGPVDLADYGIRIVNDAKDGEIGVEVINKIPFATTLMPPVYRESNGAQRFYNAINGEYEGVIFENEYSKEKPKEAITTFEDIKPTIVGVTNANGERIDIFVEFAYDLNDSDETEQTDESSESFIHPYFYAKLRKIDGANGFNLFAQAIESGEMTIEMTSGHCGACKFVIAVDENTQRNLVMVDDNGDLVYDEVTGNVKMADDAIGLDRQNDTQNYEVWIALKKDINTFGTVMPMANSTIKPSIDDTFVITNILLPQAYFTAAEKNLEDEIISFLLKNNTFQFRYSVNFSRIFLKKREDVSSQLSENVLIPIEYNGKESLLYVSSYTYRKQKADVLPEVSVSLTDNLISTPSVFQQTINSVQTNTGKAVSNVEHKTNKFVKKEIAETRKMVAETTGEFVSISGEETIKGWKNFVGGLSVNGQNIIYDKEKKVWQLVGDLLVTGAVTMFGNIGGFTPSTIMDAVLYDDITIKRNSAGQLYVASGAGVDKELVKAIIADALKNYVLTDTFNTELAKKWTRNDTQITNWDSAFDWGDHSKAGYAKATDVATQLNKYILKDTVEQISARHNFTDGLQIAGINIYKSQDKTIYLDANLVVSGAFAMFGKNSTTFETIWKDIPFDDTMEWNGSTWRVVGGANNIDVTTVNGLIYEYLNRTGEEYAKQSWVTQQGYAKQSSLDVVDNRLAAVEVFFATEDNDTLVNKWAEIVAFLNATEGDTLDSILSTKANKATTIAGYGITDAYTKAEINNTVSSLNSSIATKWTQDNTKIANWDSAYGWGNHANAGYAAKTYVDGELAKYVKLSTAQDISAQHNFVNGLKVGGLGITKSQDDVIYVDANLVVRGAVTMFGSGATVAPSIWASIPFDETMEWNGSEWSVIGGGSGSVNEATVNNLIYEYLSKNSYAKISDISSALTGYATQSWVEGKKYLTGITSSMVTTALGYTPYNSANFTKANIKSTLGISDWALASAKPTYTASEVGALGVNATAVDSSKLGGYASTTYMRASGQYFDSLNDLTTLGIYRMGGTITDGPTGAGSYGNLMVVRSNGWDTLAQLYFNINNNRVFVRSGSNTSYLTRDWSAFAFTSDIPTKLSQLTDDVVAGKYLPLSGGTVNGDLKVSGVATLGSLVRLIETDGSTLYKVIQRNSGGNILLGSDYTRDLYIDFDKVRVRSNGTIFSREVTAPTFIGNLTGNADSATKLQTPRTIWGRSFDGTEGVYGTLYGVDYIRNINSNIIICEDATDGDVYVGSNSFAKARVLINANGRLELTASGNVAIGGGTADAKLHVHGNGLFYNTLNDITWVSDTGQLIIGSTQTDYHLGFGVASNGLSAIQSAHRGVGAIPLLLNPKGGDVVIGGATVDEKLSVNGNVSITGGSNPYIIIKDDSDRRWYLQYYNNSISLGLGYNVGIVVDVNGNLLVTGAITMFSQLSMKNVIDYDGLSLAQLAQIKPARFTWVDGRDNRIHVGGIADYIQPILPEVVYETVNKELTIDYGSAAFYIGTSLIKPVVELWEAKDKQQEEIDSLKKRVEYLENKDRPLIAS